MTISARTVGAHLLGVASLPPPSRLPGGWGLRADAPTYRDGIVGAAAAWVRHRRHRFSGGPPPRLVDIARSVGCTIVADGRCSKDGALVIAAERDGRPVMLRIALAGRAVGRHGDALAAFGPHAVEVPALLAREVDRGVEVLVEAMLPGRAPSVLTSQVTRRSLDVLGDLDAHLPEVSTPSPGAERVVSDLACEVISAMRTPSGADTVIPLAAVARERLRGLPTGLQHGDLWHQNLLTDRGRLTGIVDWDSWDGQGIPAIDRLSLVGTYARLRHKQSIGTCIATRSWAADPDLLAAADLPDVDPDGLAIAWWLSSLAGSLRRMPDLADDLRWSDEAIGGAQAMVERTASTC